MTKCGHSCPLFSVCTQFSLVAIHISKEWKMFTPSVLTLLSIYTCPKKPGATADLTTTPAVLIQLTQVPDLSLKMDTAVAVAQTHSPTHHPTCNTHPTKTSTTHHCTCTKIWACSPSWYPSQLPS
eukprot:GGOE01037876.1.p2 GENE.GGOE01037876.1~~GGOE01037876.1.p2  ORF type:complete len:125 (+),score=11.09 GGOE01037876.1:278-652(+)